MERVRALTDQLEAGITGLFQSGQYAAYLQSLSKLHHYSYGNIFLIKLQCPHASMVAGYGDWKRKFGRHVKAGETGITILAPCPYWARDEVEETGPEKQEPRVIPLYRNPAAAGYASPVFGEDFDYIPVTEDVPQAAEFAVRISGDSMAPYIADGSVVYVNRDPLREGDVGIFCVDGDLFCKQYYKDPAGVVYLFSLNRKRADADVILPPSGSRGLVCFGRVILHPLPLPGRD